MSVILARKFDDISVNSKAKDKEKKKTITGEEKKKFKVENEIKKKELKSLREENKKVLKSTKELSVFSDVDEDDVFVTSNGYYDIFQIETKDIYSFSEQEMKISIYSFVSFLRNYVDDFKIISMRFPVNTSKQQEYLYKKIKETDNEIYIRFLQEKLTQLSFLEGHRSNREFFIVVFGKENKEMINNLLRNQNRAMSFKELSLEKKLKILFKLNNLNTKLM
ncbi:MAG: hypothetical protein RSA57_03770 [Cetobacterium sp.]|uniref:hypothetical protein n=1 Tax=Bacteria TaxID=2 RepID=UPI002FCBA6BA